jgi:hypothetical protein
MPAKPRRLRGDDARLGPAQSALHSRDGTETGPVERAVMGRKARPKRHDDVAYIGEVSAALAKLARQHRLAVLNYLLELVRMEAESRTGRGASGGKS